MREVKALLPSAWELAAGRTNAALRCGEIAGGRFRAPDPWYRIADSAVVRRLSPNNRKIEAEHKGPSLVTQEMLRTMGLELANVHFGTGDRSGPVKRDLAKRGKGWLEASTKAAAAAVTREFTEWQAA